MKKVATPLCLHFFAFQFVVVSCCCYANLYRVLCEADEALHRLRRLVAFVGGGVACGLVAYLVEHLTRTLVGGCILYGQDDVLVVEVFWPEEEDVKSETSIKEFILRKTSEQLDKQNQKLGTEEMIKKFYRIMTLRAVDENWIEQVDYMQQLRQVVSGRQFAQRNVMLEYHKEAHDAFMRMERKIKCDMMRNILLSDITISPQGKLSVVMP